MNLKENIFTHTSEKFKKLYLNIIENQYSFFFGLFLFTALLIFISPILIINSHIKDFIKYYLKELYNYKETYLNIIGAITGTGLAVTSALWLQRKETLKKETQEREKKLYNEKLAAKLVSNWVKRELKLLWGSWIWTSFYDRNGEKEIYFEPYIINNEKVFDSYLLIEYRIPNSLGEIFFYLFDLSEKINQYIEGYNKMNYDVVDTETVPYGTDISTTRSINSSCLVYKKVIKKNILNNLYFLFFDKNREILYYDKFILNDNKLRNLYSSSEKEFIDILKKEGNIDEFEASHELKKFLTEKKRAPSNYSRYIKKIKDISNDFEVLNKNYQNTMDNYINKLNEPEIHKNIKKLLQQLHKIL